MDSSLWQPKPALLSFDELQIWARMYDTQPLIISMMRNRGIVTEEEMSRFLYADASFLHDPFRLPDMKKASELIIRALRNQHKIGVFGDYDTDGITATALLVRGLRFFHGDVYYRVPLREEGYGLSVDAVERFHAQGVSLLITVDNGSSALEAADRCRQLGMTLIITDHHQLPPGAQPVCDAFINHQRRDGIAYPFPHLCGAAIAYKLIQALFSYSNYAWSSHLFPYLELAALGTIADLMPLTDENRIISQLGLQKMRRTPCTPLKKLCQAAKVNPHFLTSADIGFRIAPIFNASGRIADPNLAVSFLLEDTKDDVQVLSYLLKCNEERKALTQIQTHLAEELIYQNGYQNDSIIVLQGAFLEGVMGIVASRISDSFGRPCVILANSGKGSARAGPHDFSVVEAIAGCSQYLDRFGGHKAAAGLSVSPGNVQDFRLAIQQTFTLPKQYVRKREYDFALSMNKFPMYLRSELRRLEPFGMGNPQPCFFSPQTTVQQMIPFGKKQEHLKFMVEGFEALLFSGNKAVCVEDKHPHYGFLYTPSASGKLQFVLHDVKAS